MVTPAAGPVIVCVSPVFFSSSWLPESVIVWGVLKTVESKMICAFPVDSALARAMASGRLRRPAPGKSELLVVFTIRLVRTGPVLVRVERGTG